ncbi:MAG TPA: hypothetical protein ENI23_05360 [bacterium]|nr:hypothetical protein [bacterium]
MQANKDKPVTLPSGIEVKEPQVEAIKKALLADPEFLKGIHEGLKTLEGNIYPWEEVRRELGIE